MNARLVLVAVLLLSPSLALAQAPSAAELGEARRQFELGVAEYEAGQLESALVRFSRAHALSHAAELLYNVATVHERLRHDEEALQAYEAYLEAVPDAADRETIEARVRILRDAIAPEPEPEPTIEAPVVVLPIDPIRVDAPAPSASDPAPWILTGTGLAVAAAGGVLVALGAMDASTVTSTTSWADAASARDRSPTFTGAGLAAIGVGAVTAVIGIVWGTTQSSSAPRLAIGPGSLSITGTF